MGFILIFIIAEEIKQKQRKKIPKERSKLKY
jgi:hypothetical protein